MKIAPSAWSTTKLVPSGTHSNEEHSSAFVSGFSAEHISHATSFMGGNEGRGSNFRRTEGRTKSN